MPLGAKTMASDSCRILQDAHFFAPTGKPLHWYAIHVWPSIAGIADIYPFSAICADSENADPIPFCYDAGQSHQLAKAYFSTPTI
ncbi:MAG: hypothetical protein H0U72_05875 [Nitrosospira sp.]|nr:hypothetical protein [Nitrosospira sp.]